MAKVNGYKGVAMQALGVTAGNVAANFVAKVPMLNSNAKLLGAAQAVAGIVVAAKMGKKNPMIESAGIGMASKGIGNLINSIAGSSIAGIGAPAYAPDYMVNDYVASPFDKSSSLAGVGSDDPNGTL